MKIQLKIFILFLIKNILCRKQLDIPGVTNNIFLDANSLGLPKEFPSLSPIFNLLLTKDSEMYNKVYQVIKNLEHIIGYFPYFEQEILYQSIEDNLTDNNTSIFNFDKYMTLMNKEVGNEGINYFRFQHRSLSHYLTLYSKRYQLGLSCLKKVANDLSYNSKEDEYMMKFITNDINSILNAQNLMNKCTAIFAAEMINILEQRKSFLFSISINTMNKNDSTLDDFLERDPDSKFIKGFKYTENETQTIINSFKDFCICKQNFNNILHRKTLEAQIEISSMNDCINTKEVNVNAGISSKKIDDPSITIRKGETVGINNGNKIRNDGRTLNNYLLNNGLGLGKTRKVINKKEKPNFNLPTNWEEFINIVKTSNLMIPDIEEIIKKIEEDNGISYKPYPGVIRAVISSMKSENEIYDNQLSLLLYHFENSPSSFEDIEGEFAITISKTKDFEIDVSKLLNEKEIKIGNVNFNDIIRKFEIKRKINLNNNPYPDYSFTEIEILLNYINGSSLMCAIVEDSLNNKYYDIYYNGTSLSSTQAHIYAGCIAQFSSGGKNDKDTCRNNLMTKCGNELDYRCKESGLYDIISENPIADLVIPKSCTYSNDNDCLKWIDKNLFNQLTLRYSSFPGISLMVDAASKGYIQKSNNEHYVFASKNISIISKSKEKDEIIERKEILEKQFNEFYSEDFEVQGTGFIKNAPIDKLIVELDRAFSSQVNHDYFISSKKLFINILFFLIII